MATFQLRAYQKGDEARINAGFNEIFQRRRSLEEWLWKFEPQRRRSEIAVAVDAGGDVIAQYAATAVELNVDGRRYRAGQPVDVFCRPLAEARQGRLFVKTVLFFFSRFATPACLPILYGFPGERALRLGKSKLGYQHHRPVRAWRRAVRGPRLRWPKLRLRGAPTRFQVRAVPDPGAVDQLWRRCAPRYPVAIARDSVWLERRFGSHPDAPYRYFGVHDHERLRAWVVLRFAGDTARWVDLLWDGDDPAALTTLQEHLARVARRRGSTGFELWMAGDAAIEAQLPALGWIPETGPQLPDFAVRSFDPTIGGGWLLKNFYYTLADTDLA